ncbi:MAG: hypothetical protein N2595_10060 [bacterium]|nr:hypothetical protein [bacterium]
MKRILLIAGEPSGDHSGAYLVQALRRRLPTADLFGVGGENMQAAGLRLIHNITELSVIGLVEPLIHLPRLLRVRNDLLRQIAADQPDAIVFIDYPGFNLHLAKHVKRRWPHIPIIYFISPQIWAYWHWRIYTIRRVVDLMLVMFPFEVDIYERNGRFVRTANGIRVTGRGWKQPAPLQVRCVGHWITTQIAQFQPDPTFLARERIPPDRTIVALLAGSRQNEITSIFPVMLQAAERLRCTHSHLLFLISCARPTLRPLLDAVIARARIPQFDTAYRVTESAMYDVLYHAHLVIAKSGTSAFEAALFHKPVIVLYRLNWFSALALRLLARIPFVNLANIIAGRPIVPELLQRQMTPERIAATADAYLRDRQLYERTVKDLAQVHDQLGHGDAGERAACEIIAFLQRRNIL